MKTLQQRRLEFLNEMVAYYSEDTSRRASDRNRSYYRLPNSNNKCAIGRYISDEDYNNNPELDTNYALADDYMVLALLPENVRRLGGNFLYEVQTLHDENTYWNNGLTTDGLKEVERIKSEYCE